MTNTGSISFFAEPDQAAECLTVSNGVKAGKT